MITVGYGHADKLAAISAAGAPAGSTKPALLIDPALYWRDDVRPILAERDIAPCTCYSGARGSPSGRSRS